jgi:hypothetical protein
MQIIAVSTSGMDGSLSCGGANLIQTVGVIAYAVGTNEVRDIFVGAFLYTIN